MPMRHCAAMTLAMAACLSFWTPAPRASAATPTPVPRPADSQPAGAAGAQPPGENTPGQQPALDLAALLRDLAAGPRRTEALALLDQLPPSAIVPLGEALADPGIPTNIRRDLEAVLTRLYAKARELRVQQQAQAASVWMTTTGVDAYKRLGASEQWDAMVLKGFEDLTTEPQTALDNLRSAVDGGLRDPLVRLTYLSEALPLKKVETAEALRQLDRVVEDMEDSDYPAGRKLLANLLLAEYALQPGTPSEITADRIRAATMRATQYFPAFAKENPDYVRLRDVARKLYLCALARGGQRRPEAYQQVFPAISKALPESPVTCYIDALHHLEWTWETRGTGAAPTADSDEGKALTQRLDQAHAAAEKGWRLDPLAPDCAATMVLVATEKNLSREIKELWFQRAIGADPYSPAAFTAKMRFLLPKWGGTVGEVLEFGRTCVRAGDARNRLPTVLVAAYAELRAGGQSPPIVQYYRDMQLVYNKLLADQTLLQSNRSVYLADRAAYLKAACEARQWRDAAAMFRDFGMDVDVEAFGGQALFDYFRRRAESDGGRGG